MFAVSLVSVLVRSLLQICNERGIVPMEVMNMAKQEGQTRPARIQVQMSEDVAAQLQSLSVETGLPRVLLGSMALSIGVVSIRSALEAAKSGDAMAQVPGFQAGLSSVLAGYKLEGDDEVEKV